ncbi:MAG: UbiD family decarboxylase [Betaproteobacteria bacterium]|nr:UbiD family decarboxylase [Betaproteobacteria bacterium]
MNAKISASLDTSFRSAIGRMLRAGRIRVFEREANPHLDIAGIMNQLDGGPSLLFSNVKGHDMPVIGNVLSCRENCEAAFGMDYRGIREVVGRALGNPVAPRHVDKAPVHEHVYRDDFDIGRVLPVLTHTEADSGRFITGGIIIVQDPETGVYNASYHRLQLIGARRTAIKLDFGRHLRAAYERAQRMGKPLPIAVCIGTDIAVYYAAATMGSQMPESADELAVAGGLRGDPISLVKAITQDIYYPAETEIVLEGALLPDETVREGPFGEFVGYLSPEADAPVFEVSALAHRSRPIYHAINGVSREPVMLRKYVMEASLLKALQAATPIVDDVEMTAGGLFRFHAVISVRKTSPQHEGLQRNAILAAFATLKDLDLVIAVDDDIDIRDTDDVEYALAMRMEASQDLFIIPEARTHEYVRASRNGVRAKLGIDATVPFEEKARYARLRFKNIDIDERAFSSNPPASLPWLAER